MKKKLTTLIILLISITAMAQRAINYKALIKDDLGNVVANQNITIEFSILEGPEIAFTDIVYVETHSVTTDANGIVIANIGEGVPETGFENGYGLIEWGSFFGSHFLKVQIDTGSGLIDMGTTEFNAVPYALYAESSNNSGLEAINEGNGTGRRLIGMNPDNYGPIANFAVDLSYSPASSTTRGATGDYAAALGYQTTASGYSSFASGVNTMATGTQSTAMGAGTVASGNSSTALGIGTKAEAPNTTAIGLFNVGGGDPLQASTTDPLFEIGNGQYVDGTNDIRSNALTVLRNGTVTAPSFEMAQITDPKALITKEYADANYSGGGTGTSSTGLEALDEGNGIGWRFVGTDPAVVPESSQGSIDLNTNINAGILGLADISGLIVGNFSFQAGNTSVALGESSIAMGQGNLSDGFASIAIGSSNFSTNESSTSIGASNNASGDFSTAIGLGNVASGSSSTAIGLRTIADDDLSMVVGRNNDPTELSNVVFQVGNGANSSNRSNALNINVEGIITAPSFDISEITDPKALITKEYADANYSGGGTGTSPTGLEALDEGNGTGWRLIGTDPANYGNIGSKSVDLSFSGAPSTTFGPTGSTSITAGNATTASGDASAAFGAGTTASGPFSLTSGYYTTASGNTSTAFGSNTIADDSYSTVVGQYNNETELSNVLFQVGNGTSSGSKSNALNVTMDGIITAPSLDINEITDSKTLITKEYADANLSASGLEAIDEGNGIGWRLVGSNPDNFGDIGLNAVDLSLSSVISDLNGALGDYSFSVGNYSRASATNALALGYSANAYNSGSVAIGTAADSGGNNSIAIGFHAQSFSSYSTAIGYYAVANENNAISIGESTTSSGVASVAMGSNTTASSDYAFSSGSNTTASGFYSTSLGRNTLASNFASTALGSETIADDQFSTVLGRLNDNTTSTTTLFQVGNGTTGGGRSNAFTVFQSGNATLAGTLTQSSDKRLKQDIIELDYGLKEVLQLNPVSYHWKKHPDQPKSLGLIAQDIQPIIKEIVHQAENKDKTLSVSYTELIPVLIKAIQEQQVIIDNQKQVISSQEQTNTKQTEALQALLERVEALEKQSVSTAQIKIVKN
ncbi:hypothetical protein EVU94_12855 [Flavobacteriaceae bacterium 144Ye]|nr:hypothetical protein EVU94_12855 [Flavobacteriaceae bacterium 144Ye]